MTVILRNVLLVWCLFYSVVWQNLDPRLCWATAASGGEDYLLEM